MKSRIDKWGDYKLDWAYHRDYYSSFFLNNYQYFQPKKLMINSIVVFFCLGFFRPVFHAFFITFLGLYLYSYFAASKLMKHIHFTRRHVKKSQEEKTELVEYQFQNPYDIEFSNIVIRDQFSGMINRSGDYRSFFPRLLPHRKVLKTKELELNNGMGLKNFGPLLFVTTDVLGINRIIIEQQDQSSMEVYPKVYPSKVPKSKSNLHSINFGDYDTFTRGNSVNFFRVREYVLGDPLNHINWKLSSKGQGILINEFEHNSNANVVVLFNDDQRLHVGEGANSTFEYTKDLTLSLLQQHARSNNAFGLFGHKKFIKSSSGLKHLHYIERYLMNLDLMPFSGLSPFQNSHGIPAEAALFMKKVRFHLDQHTNLFVMTSFIPGKIWDYYFDKILELAPTVGKVHLIIVEGFGSLLKSVTDTEKKWIYKMIEDLPKKLNEIEVKCRKHHIHLKIIRVNSDRSYKDIIRGAFV